MYLKSLILENFRLFTSKKIVFEQKIVVLLGKNGLGKTAILEAIILGSAGKSFRANKVEEMVKFEAEYGKVVLNLSSNFDFKFVSGSNLSSDHNASLDLADLDSVKLELMLSAGLVQGKKTAKQLYRVNDLKRSKRKFLGNFYSVIFRPEDMRLVEGSPGRRRNFLDEVLEQTDIDYARSLATYEQALKRINRLLLKIREGEADERVLTYWHMTMLKHGQLLQKKRQDFFEFSKGVEFPVKFLGEYQPSVISQMRLEQYLPRAIASGHSLIGPQKDDFIVRFAKLDNRDVAIYGSRGQQRLAVLWLKICALHFLQNHTQTLPILLLDDIFSELDETSRSLLLSLFSKHQVIITSADETVTKILSEQKINFQKTILN